MGLQIEDMIFWHLAIYQLFLTLTRYCASRVHKEFRTDRKFVLGFTVL